MQLVPYLGYGAGALSAWGAGGAVGRWYNRRYRSVVPYKKTNYRRRKFARIKAKINAIELKTHDKAISESPSSTGTLTCLNLVAEGDESINREGLKTTAMKLYGRLQINAHASATTTKLRIIILRDNDSYSDTLVPTIATILESASYNALFKHETRSRFRILYDKTTLVGNTASNLPDERNVKVNVKLPKKGQKLHYIGTAAAQTSTGNNSLWLVMISSEATNVPAVAGTMRLRFYG